MGETWLAYEELNALRGSPRSQKIGDATAESTPLREASLKGQTET